MDYSQLVTCRHCGNISQMTIIGSAHEDFTEGEPEYGMTRDWSIYYSVLKCPACDRINIVSYTWTDSMEDFEGISYEFLYPRDSLYPLGLPENILSAYKVAEKAKVIDVNLYAIAIRRLLELVCLDKEAKPDSLATMLDELSKKNEIPQKLVKVASGLRNFGNAGAHAGSGELTEKEIPTVTALCNAILEYVYSAPHLATVAEERLDSIKTKSKPKK